MLGWSIGGSDSNDGTPNERSTWLLRFLDGAAMNERKYTQFDWASDRLARTSWAEDEDRMMAGIDRRMNKKNKAKKPKK